jgi:hypothetical protein
MRTLACAVALLPCTALAQEKAAPLSALARLPVKEVTVFKDGHAYVIHEGKVAADPDGEVRMDYLPTPILGTFWVYAADAKTPARKVTASVRRVLVERTALSIPDLIAANVGADVTVREKVGKPYQARIVGIPERSSEEVEATGPPNSDPRLPERSSLVLLATNDGVLTVPLERIEAVAFRKPPRPKLAQEEYRNLLTVTIPGAKRGDAVAMGLMYVQRGIRWIPSYQVVIDGKGSAKVRMQATLVNEMLDLKDAVVHLVVGVPTFAFKDTPDPMGLQQTFARLSQYFDRDARAGQVLSNAVMGQAARMGERVRSDEPAGPGMPDVPELGGGEKAEDLFVFKVDHVTLKKGARMVLPVVEMTLPYKDVYILNIPYALPPALRTTLSSVQQADIARAMAAPTVQHKLRLSNTSAYPLTTAPALILSGGRVLAQGMMTYTALKADTDLELTTAVDVKVKRSDIETGRKPDVLTVNGNKYGRADYAGKISLVNYRAEAVSVEVTRYVAGFADEVGQNGEAENIDPLDEERLSAGGGDWERWYSWPWWWRQVNGFGRFRWKVAVEPGKAVELTYAWHWFWQ